MARLRRATPGAAPGIMRTRPDARARSPNAPCASCSSDRIDRYRGLVAEGAGFSWAHLGLVALGGALGTTAREVLAVVGASGWPELTVPAINVVGSFALGVLVGVLARFRDGPRTQAIRLFVGTGLLGGFTTYSAFALQALTVPVWITGATVVVGAAVALAGLLCGRPRAARP